MDTIASRTTKTVHYCVDTKNPVVVSNFAKRGWTPVPFGSNWDLYWASSYTNIINQIKRHQKVNHFPNSHELCRKDLLAKNLKQYQKEHMKRHGHLDTVDFLPTTFYLPSDYSLFLREYRNQPNRIWIMKPCRRSQGNGICLVNSTDQVARQMYMAQVAGEAYLISRYIENPLLIGGRKFDLRLFVLVISFRPLRAYLYKDGFCRFCAITYDNSHENLENKYIHLTNVSIQKTGSQYNRIHGGKWSVNNLKLHLESTRGHEVTEQLFDRIAFILRHSLKAVQAVMHNNANCFECFGYDIIIDNMLKPWLVEVNSSPSLTCSTETDRILKTRLIDNILNVIFPTDEKDPINEQYFKDLFINE